MIKLEVKDFYSPDVDSVWQWKPENLEDVYFLLEINIGEVGNDASDIFQVIVATPEGLRAAAPNSDEDFILSERACLVLKDFSWNKLLQRINRVVDSCADKDWVESSLKLQRYFQWEYENYVTDDLC